MACILDSDEIRDAVIEQKCREMQQTNEEKEARRQSRGCFYRGSLLPGERLETEESIVIIGDVPQEAVVVSQSAIPMPRSRRFLSCPSSITLPAFTAVRWKKQKIPSFPSVIRPHRRKWLSSVTVLLI